MKHIFKILFTIYCLLFVAYRPKAQVNLVMNPSFEELVNCPAYVCTADTAQYWTWVNNTTWNPSNQHDCRGSILTTCCTIPYNCGIPDTYFGYQWPRTGSSFICLATAYSPPVNPSPHNGREYLKGQLTTTLQIGKNYCLTFYYNATNEIQYATNRFGAYVDNGIVATYSCCAPMPVTPQVQNDTNVFMTDTLHWVKIQGSFTAIGNENTITLGNFVDSSVIKRQLFNSSAMHVPLYNIDDVSLIAMDLVPYAGHDTTIALNDSTYIGRASEVGLDDDCIWYVLGNTTPLDTIAGMWVKPTTTTNYVVEQNICGIITYDTVLVSVIPTGIKQFMANNKQFMVYPNPTTGTVYISTTNISEVNLYVEVQDLTGRAISKQNLPVNNGVVTLQNILVNGAYMINMRGSDGKTVTQRLVVNN